VREAARPAVPDDASRLVELAAAARAELAQQKGGPVFLAREARDPLLDRELVALATTPGRCVLVGTIDDVVVGYAVAHVEGLRDATRLAVIDDLYVESEAREVSVGEALMDDILTWAQAEGCRGVDAVALPGNRPTKNFFERFGLVARAILVHRPLGPSGEQP
jgi:ribosomal protein S18 acetylase RimI-like enzyme